MSDYRREIAGVVRSVRVIDDETLAIGGRSIRCEDLTAGWTGAATKDSMLVTAATALIYSAFYVRRRFVAQPLVDDGYLERLSAANRSVTGWDGGWLVVERSGERFVVEKEGLRLYAQPIDLDPDAPTPGQKVFVRIGKERRKYFPEFYFMNGGTRPAEHGAGATVRVYFNLDFAGAVPFVEAVTSSFDRSEVPFRAKVLSDPASFGRADAGVVYLQRTHYLPSREILARIPRQIGRRLGKLTPRFTKRVAPGIAVAEDPGGGRSFGEHRSRALGIAIVRARALGGMTLERRVDLAHEAFRQNGIDPAHPYLTLGNPDLYETWT